MHSKIAISACRRVSHGRRQISSTVIVLKNVSTAALSSYVRQWAISGNFGHQLQCQRRAEPVDLRQVCVQHSIKRGPHIKGRRIVPLALDPFPGQRGQIIVSPDRQRKCASIHATRFLTGSERPVSDWQLPFGRNIAQAVSTAHRWAAARNGFFRMSLSSLRARFSRRSCLFS